jgi:hypothetical protein
VPTASDPTPTAGGKGRPTPKRREAQARRRAPVVAPANRREAAKLARSQLRDRRRTARAALASGDERNLPARDAGAIRGYARDFVDSRRNAGGAFLPVALVMWAFSVAPVPGLRVAGYLLLPVLLLIVVGDGIYVARTIRTRAAARFPGQSTKGVGLYAAVRGTQIRRLRLPPPRVTRGTKV